MSEDKTIRIEYSDRSLIEKSDLRSNDSGVVSWLTNLKERWVGFEKIDGVNKKGESYIEYVFDNGCGLVDSVKLINFNTSNYRMFSEMEKEQLLVYFIPMKTLICGGKEPLASMVSQN